MANPQRQRRKQQTAKSDKQQSQPVKQDQVATDITQDDQDLQESKKTSTWFSKKLYNLYGIVWIYFFVKICVLDCEAWLLDLLHLGHYKAYLLLRVFLIPIILLLSIARWGFKQVFRHIFHLLTAPFYFTIFLLLKTVFIKIVTEDQQRRNPHFLVFLLESLGRLISNIYFATFFSTGVLFLTISLFFPTQLIIQYSSILISIVLFLGIAYQSIIRVISQPKIFGFLKIDQLVDFSKKSVGKRLRSKNKEKETPNQRIREQITVHIIIYVLQKNIEDIRNKKSFILVTLADFFFSISITILILAFLNYSIFLVFPSAFSVPKGVTFLDFFEYVFYAIPGESTDIVPGQPVSKIVKMLITYYGYYLLIFLASILFGVFSDKFTTALEQTVHFLRSQKKLESTKLSSLLGINLEALSSYKLSELFALMDKYKEEGKEEGKEQA